MSEPNWTVTAKEKNIELIEPGEEDVFNAYKCRTDDRKKAVFEYTLRFQGKAGHVLTGERGKEILEDFAADLNRRGYEPKFVKGKMLTELSPAQVKKLALLQSPPLPL